ncbi:MAG: hypothetical protein K6A72_08035 [Lachnospiraceae bacterium]|nr:hypothetical protein [Lachnospiraceae bacterium]
MWNSSNAVKKLTGVAITLIVACSLSGFTTAKANEMDSADILGAKPSIVLSI